MNANELADEYTHNVIKWDEAQLFEWCSKSSAMLRQLGLAESIIKQQEIEIETLKKQCAMYEDFISNAGWKQHEPVNPYQSITDTKIEPTVVSYTHPAKELTDEEIGQIWKDCMESPYMQVSNPVGFARAILRKAQEK